MFQTERNGVLINDPLTMIDNAVSNRHFTLAMENDGKTAIAVSVWGSRILSRVNIDSAPPLSPFSRIDISATVTTGTYISVAFDPSTPDFVYLAYQISGASRRIVEHNKHTGAATGNFWALPAAFSTASDIGGLYVEPTTGDFIIARNLVYTAGGNNYIDFYRITRAGAFSTFAINLTRLGIATAGANGVWQFAYDPKTNRLFLADYSANRVYEAVPPVIITPRQ